MKIFYALLFCFLLVSCKDKTTVNSPDSKEGVKTEEKSGPEYTSKYTCPMHCKGSGSAAEGKCPVCGMDYVLTKEEENK